MKYLLIGVFALVQTVSFAGEDDSYRFYKGGNQRAWNYAERLIVLTEDPDRETLERDLSSDAFTYWVLRSLDKTPRNRVFERSIRRAFVELKLIRNSVALDPLGRSSKNRRGVAIVGVVVDDEKYPKMVNDFRAFISQIPQ